MKPNKNDVQILKFLIKKMGPKAKKRIYIMIGFSLLLATLDLLGVGSAIIILYMLFSESIGTNENSTVRLILDFTNLDELNFNLRIFIVSGVLLIFFTTKTLLGIFLTSRTQRFLAHESISLGNKYIEKIYNFPYESLAGKKGQRLLQSCTSGLENLYVIYVGGFITISVEIIIILVLTTSLIFIEPIGLLLIALLFTSTLIPLNLYLGRKLRQVGQSLTDRSLLSSSLILDGISLIRELQISGRQSFYTELAKNSRGQLIEYKAKVYTLNVISKYLIEVITIVSGVIFAGIQVWISDIRSALQAILIFGLVSSRIIPSLMRIHGVVLSLKQAKGQSSVSLELLREADELEFAATSRNKIESGGESRELESTPQFEPSIVLRNVQFSHEKGLSRIKEFSLGEISLTIEPGEKIGILGRSGSGKSTLLEIILGFRNPTGGEIVISGKNPIDAMSIWKGSIAYVPQESKVVDLSIGKNVALSEEVVESRVKDCLKISQISELFDDIMISPEEHLGNIRNKLSGGEKQRVGLARGIYLEPKLLVLDESTSALDLLTEENLLNALLRSASKSTIIMVSHRPTALSYMDRVIYLKEGKLIDIDKLSRLKSKYSEILDAIREEKN